MKNDGSSRWLRSGLVPILGAAALAAVSIGMAEDSLSGREVMPAAAPPVAEPARADSIAVAPPPFSEGVFPCSQCHDDSDSVNTTPRKLTDNHEEIVLQHDEKNRWCLDCHDAKNRDKLHLASGKPVEFTESYRLCGQCHGPELRDWRAGVHGKRTGSWSGQKQYLLCAHCHNPHSPRFKPRCDHESARETRSKAVKTPERRSRRSLSGWPM